MKYELPTVVYQERNCVAKHGKELASIGSKALIVTGKNSSKKNGSLSDVCQTLEDYQVDYVIFDEIEENPSIETCVKAAEIGLSQHVDFCIGIGGGSPLDASKAIALLIANKTTVPDMFYQPELARITAVPVVSVPTTAGTGSEATPYAILTIHKSHTKQSIKHRIFPVLSLCDPNYLTFIPFGVLKNTAIDTLAHLIESYLNTNATAYSRMFVEYGLKLWGSFKDDLADMSMTDDDFDAMMEAATIAGMAISHTGTSLPHGLSYAVTYELGIPHGAACGLFLPGYMFYCMKMEKMKAESKSSAMTLEDSQKIFELLGLKNIEEFARMLYTLLGDIPVSEEIWQNDIDILMENPAKLNNCPYPVEREDIDQFI